MEIDKDILEPIVVAIGIVCICGIVFAGVTCTRTDMINTKIYNCINYNTKKVESDKQSDIIDGEQFKIISESCAASFRTK